MQESRLAIVIAAQENAPSGQDMQKAVLRSFSERDIHPDVAVVRYSKRDRICTLNAWFEQNIENADRFLVLDAGQVSPEDAKALTGILQDRQTDIVCRCARAIKDASFEAHRRGFADYLCDCSDVLFFSEKAVLRMRTADTTDLLQEALSEPSLSVARIPTEPENRQSIRDRLRLIRYGIGVREVVRMCCIGALVSAVIFLILLLCGHVAAGWIGCIVSVHICLFSAGTLLILWYRTSKQIEEKKHHHTYVGETRLK